ncbi:PREDICTED: LOW QUALITY PROTEIN: meteorin [Tinamus guttatus]|uniref:LOW QUALITY PROTEIN: meteorin n=1 Tax=Tinamus guttatus TaxID=94827 RepID=UPI00052F0EFB|nr:PREDICTED: LOW QUALITY PROTEIN: meteorin [Tinamus guttatus]
MTTRKCRCSAFVREEQRGPLVGSPVGKAPTQGPHAWTPSPGGLASMQQTQSQRLGLVICSVWCPGGWCPAGHPGLTRPPCPRSGLSQEAGSVEQLSLRCAEGSLEWLYPTGALRLSLSPRLPVAHRPRARCFSWLPREKVALFLQATPHRDISRRIAAFRYELRGGALPASSASGEGTCRPCNDTEILMAICTSDFVVRGSIPRRGRGDGAAAPWRVTLPSEGLSGLIPVTTREPQGLIVLGCSRRFSQPGTRPLALRAAGSHPSVPHSYLTNSCFSLRPNIPAGSLWPKRLRSREPSRSSGEGPRVSPGRGSGLGKRVRLRIAAVTEQMGVTHTLPRKWERASIL